MAAELTPKRLLQRGFTLLEMIFAIAISTIVVGGLYSLFNVQSKQFLIQDMQMSMHQSLRFAQDILTRSTRMAGYGSGGSTSGPWGWDGSENENATLPAVISYNGWDGSHDAITVFYADPSLEMTTTATVLPACETSALTFDMTTRNYASLIENYDNGELLICWDVANIGGVSSYMWAIDAGGSSSGGEISVVPNQPSDYTDYDNLCEAGENLPPTLNCSKAHVMTFYIDDSEDAPGPGSESHPVLMMDLNMDWPSADDVPLVDDIEDLQIAYCLANTDCSQDASWINSRDLTANEGSQVWMVRFSLVARSPRLDPNEVYSVDPPSLEDHTPSSDDNYYRQVLTTMVTVRNMRF